MGSMKAGLANQRKEPQPSSKNPEQSFSLLGFHIPLPTSSETTLLLEAHFLSSKCLELAPSGLVGWEGPDLDRRT